MIAVDFVTEPGVLSDRHLITRLTNHNGNVTFDAQIRLDFDARDANGELIWDPADVTVDFEALGSDDPEVRAAVIREIQLNGNLLPDEGDFLAKLREEAGKLGANTLFVQTMEDPGTAERIASGVFGTSADRDSDSLALYCPST